MLGQCTCRAILVLVLAVARFELILLRVETRFALLLRELFGHLLVKLFGLFAVWTLVLSRQLGRRFERIEQCQWGSAM